SVSVTSLFLRRHALPTTRPAPSRSRQGQTVSRRLYETATFSLALVPRNRGYWAKPTLFGKHPINLNRRGMRHDGIQRGDVRGTGSRSRLPAEGAQGTSRGETGESGHG